MAKIIKKGKYFNITGTDGSGKDTVINGIEKVIPLNETVLFREPGGTEKAEFIRNIILTKSEKEREYYFNKIKYESIYYLTRKYIKKAFHYHCKNKIGKMETFLYAASRNETNKDIVFKNLMNNKNVFGSRSISCSMAYQGKARGLGIDYVKKVNDPVMRVKPDFEIFLDIPVNESLERLKKRTGKQDRLDTETEKFHLLSKEGYIEYYKTNPFPVYFVNADDTKENVIEKVKDILKKENII